MSSDTPPLPPPPPASSEAAGVEIDESQPRVFPCEGCGADFEFHIGAQRLQCPFCGFEKDLEIDPDAAVEEQDLHAALDRVAGRRREQAGDGGGEAVRAMAGVREVRCVDCGATLQFHGTLTSDECAYCGTPIQEEGAHEAEDRIPVDGVLPFKVERATAKRNLADWVKGRWFAPSEFKRRGAQGRFSGVYLPFWTYDALTANNYRGERGEHYWVEVGSGENKRRERRTRWYSASGSFRRFFDDVLVLAGRGLPTKLVRKLDPWPLGDCIPFTPAALAGYLARTYDVELDVGFEKAKQRIEAAIRDDVRRRIGGDEQRIHGIDTSYGALTYKHLLLPLWLLSYRFGDKTYQVVVNAATGEVQGERPWSVLKITLAVLGVLAVGGLIYYFANS